MEKFWLVSNNISKINPSFFDELRNLKHLDLTGNSCVSKNFVISNGNLEEVKKDLADCFDNYLQQACNFMIMKNYYICYFENITVRTDQKFDVYGDHHPGRSNSDVNGVEFSSSMVSEIPDEIFLKFQNLENLNVESTGLKMKIPLKNCTKLRKFKGSFNKIEQVYSKTFAECIDLQLIDLKSNKIKKLEPLKNCKKLLKLYLSHNHIESLQVKSFTACFNLEFIELQSNSIKKLPSNLFGKKLVSIDLSRNLINAISPCQKFQGFKNLMSVDLSGNKCINAVISIKNGVLKDVQKLLSFCHSSWLIEDITGLNLKPMKFGKNEL